MLPYSAMAGIDYAAYQSRPGLSTNSNNVGAALSHSWLVPTQDLGGVNAGLNHQQTQHSGHVFVFIYFCLSTYLIDHRSGFLLLLATNSKNFSINKYC
jgi:hypothetical protein